tara:strand:+ start:157 stop:366 length:210 start_codon:yes stop_codon:yes gene_type:complete
MTEENFFDMLNRVHNPEYYYGKKKDKKKTKRKTISRRRNTISKGKSGVDRLRKRQRLGKRKRIRQDEVS